MKFFKKLLKEQHNNSRLEKKIRESLPETNEKKLTIITCIAGLMARVAYIDFEIHKDEMQKMNNVLGKWSHLNENEIKVVVKIAIEEIQDLAGLENHLYCPPLNKLLDNTEKFELLKALFQLAASDDKVENNEAEEIRLIAKGLLLEHRHFLAARAKVLDKLQCLKE